MEPCVIRKGTLSDITQVFRILQGMVEAEKLENEFLNSEKGLRDDFGSGCFEFLVAEGVSKVGDSSSKVVLGCLLYSVAYEYVVGATMFFQGCYVTAEYKGHRLEKDLILEAKRLASEARIRTMITFTTTGNASPMKVLVEEGAKDLDANLGHDVFFLTYNPVTTEAFDDQSATFKAREGNKSDMSAIYDLLRELTVLEGMDHVFVTSREEFCEASKASDLFQTVVVEYRPSNMPPQIIGCAIISKFYNFLKGTVHYIQGLYIQPSYRGTGNGKRLVRAILEISHGQGVDELLLMVQRGNAKSQALFKRFGANNITTSENRTVCLAFTGI